MLVLRKVGDLMFVTFVLGPERDLAVLIRVELVDPASLLKLADLIQKAISSPCEMEVGKEVESSIFPCFDGMQQSIPG